MNVKLVAAIMVVIAGGITASVLLTVPSAEPERSVQTPRYSVSPIPASSKAPTTPGKYVDYTPDTIASTSGTKLLFFHAPWCSQCQQLDKDLRSIELPSDVTVFKVDYDTQNDLRIKYAVTLQTTLVKISNDGQLIKKFVAYDEPTFENVRRNLLD